MACQEKIDPLPLRRKQTNKKPFQIAFSLTISTSQEQPVNWVNKDAISL